MTSTARLLRRFWPELRQHRRPAGLSILFGLVASGAVVLAPWPLKLIIDNVFTGDGLPGPLHVLDGSPRIAVFCLGGAFLLVAASAALAGAAQKLLAARVREALTLGVRDRLLGHLQLLPTTIRTHHRGGALVQRLVSDTALFGRLVTKTLPVVFRHAATLALTLAVMAATSLPLAAMSLLLFPVMVLLARRYAPPLARAARAKLDREGDVAGHAQEIVRGLPVLQATGAELEARTEFERVNRASLDAGVRRNRIAVSMERTLQIAHGAALALATLGGSLLVLEDHLTVGMLTVVIAYLNQLLKPVEKINELVSAVTKGVAAGDRLCVLLDEKPLVHDEPHAVDAGRTRGLLKVEAVRFRYPGTRAMVLDGVGFSVSPGELAVVVGPSGGGKSTLFALLLRLFDPTEGRILLDGRPLSSFTLRSLRSQFAFLPQDTHFFAGTIRNALATGRAHSDETLWHALSLVRLDGFVRDVSGGLAGRIGEDGLNLSGGQRRRLALARAFLLDRPMLVLDEPVANVDAESETAILDAIERLRVGRACLVSSHRPGVLARADAVYRLEQGRLARVSAGQVRAS